MSISKWHIDPTVNVGTIIQALVLIGSLGTFAWMQAGLQAQYRSDLNVLKSSSDVYVPIINQMVKSDDIQNERIGNLTNAVTEIRKSSQETSLEVRKSQNETNALLGDIREDMATLKAQLNNVRK